MEPLGRDTRIGLDPEGGSRGRGWRELRPHFFLGLGSVELSPSAQEE